MNLLIIFILLSIVNVIFSTIKSIVTIKSGPWVRVLFPLYTMAITTLY